MSCCFVSLGVVFGYWARHVSTPLPRRKGAACSRFVIGMFHVGLESVEFVFGLSCVSVMQDRLRKGLPSVATLDSLLQFLYSLRFDALSIAFRVAGFGRADLTKFPWISPVTCEGDTTLMLASCKESMPRIIRLDLVVCESYFAGV